jgi:cytochrome c oxidase assembly protein subunit 11
MPSLPSRRAVTVTGIVAVIAIMVALVSVSVPLYRLFCSVTGAGGTTQRVAADTATRSPKQVTVYFNTDVAPGLNWSFEPVQRSVTLHLGDQVPAYFAATNLSDHAIVGHATFNVTPDKVGIYFKKVQCFCFTEERLAAHQTVQMPVQFFVDPAIASDPDTREVTQITLSYTFFESKRPDGAPDLARLAVTVPDAGRGATLFATNCAACHALDRNKIGPALGGVVGRQAARAAGYPYSAALTHAGIVWTPVALAKWLTNPQADVPGALMPMSVSSAPDRGDIIAYLQQTPSPAAAVARPEQAGYAAAVGVPGPPTR